MGQWSLWEQSRHACRTQWWHPAVPVTIRAHNTPPAASGGPTRGELSEAQSTYKVSLLHVWLRRGADRPEATLSTGVRTRFEQKESGGLLKNTEDPGALSHTAFKLGLFFCIFQLLQLKNPHVARKGPTGPSLLISLPSPGTQESVGGRVCWENVVRIKM